MPPRLRQGRPEERERPRDLVLQDQISPINHLVVVEIRII